MVDDFERMWSDLAPVGRSSSSGGYFRQPFTQPERELADWFREQAAARDLAPVLGWSVSKTEEALTGDAGFSYLRKNVEPEVRDAAIALRIPGIGADRVADRL